MPKDIGLPQRGHCGHRFTSHYAAMNTVNSPYDHPETCSGGQIVLERPPSKPEEGRRSRRSEGVRIGPPPRLADFQAIAHPARRAADKLVPDESYEDERVLLTLVFTDIVGSTKTLEEVGDRVWCALLLHHHELVREHLKACRGREVDAAGDGFFLAFDRPSRAVCFALVVRDALRKIGLEVRVGIHVGECQVIGERVEGLAVHTAARVAGKATAGEILVSSTVKDLVAGSQHRFNKREVCLLKGLSEPRALFALESANTTA